MLNPQNHRKFSRRSHSCRLLGCLIISGMTAPVALAADNPGAHEHGRAQLQMALENNQIDLMFTSPAYNLAGFEHDARTDEQRQQLASIRQWLETTPLINTGTGNCTVTAATVQLGEEGGSHQGHDHHEEAHHHDEEHDHHHGHDEHDDHASHRDYDVAQQLSCEGMNASDAFTSPLPGRFPELEELNVEWVGPTGQGSTVINQPGQNFTLNR